MNKGGNMRNKIFVLLCTAVSLSFFGFINHPPKDKEPGFVGTKSCGMCHKKAKDGAQLKIWEESQHAKAYETLNSEAADKISQELYSKKAIEAEECLICHASGYDVNASLIGKKFKIEDGVQCETCHGPGSDYKSLKIMKDREKSVANGLRVFQSEEEIEKFCSTCHNADSPTYVEFKFEDMWRQISHDIPEKN